MRRALFALGLAILVAPSAHAEMSCGAEASYAKMITMQNAYLGDTLAATLKQYPASAFPDVQPIIRDIYAHPQFSADQMAARTRILCQRRIADYLTQN